jgi:hypothetical protein
VNPTSPAEIPSPFAPSAAALIPPGSSGPLQGPATLFAAAAAGVSVDDGRDDLLAGLGAARVVLPLIASWPAEQAR